MGNFEQLNRAIVEEKLWEIVRGNGRVFVANGRTVVKVGDVGDLIHMMLLGTISGQRSTIVTRRRESWVRIEVS